MFVFKRATPQLVHAHVMCSRPCAPPACTTAPCTVYHDGVHVGGHEQGEVTGADAQALLQHGQRTQLQAWNDAPLERGNLPAQHWGELQGSG